MRIKSVSTWVFATLALFQSSCSDDIARNSISDGTGTGVLKLESAVNHTNVEFANLTNKVRGSVGTNGPGSRVVWSRKNDYSLGLFISASHVYGLDAWNSRTEEFVDISNVNNGIFGGSQMPPMNGNIILGNELTASFGLYHPSFSPGTTKIGIHPQEDFYLGVLDNQKRNDNGLGIYPETLQKFAPLQMFDPENRTLASQTWAVAAPNDPVIVVGYPRDRATYPNGAVSTGKVFSDEEAMRSIESLRTIGDAEGEIPYEREAEFLANAEAKVGMSGGGVFNGAGQLVGVMVRATVLDGKPILRAVRTTYIRAKINTFYEALPTSEKSKFRQFLGSELN